MTIPWTPPWRPPPIVISGAPPPERGPGWTQRGSATSTVTPTTGILPGQNLKSWANWRAALYGFTPVAMTLLTALYLQFPDSKVLVWVMLALAVVTPLLSAYNTEDKLRRIAYAVMGLLQTAGFTATLLVGHEAYIPIVSTVITVISSTLARYHTPTTTLKPKADG